MLGMTAGRSRAALGLCVLAVCVEGCGGSTTTTTTTRSGQGAVTVEIVSPSSGTVINANNATIRGTVSPVNATVEVDGSPVQVGDGVFAATVPLGSGSTRVDVIASATGMTPSSTSIVLSREGASSAPTATGTTSTASSNVADAQSDQTSCGGGLYVGPHTTCAFAQNVEQSYDENGDGTYSVYSPVTSQTYSMDCEPDGTEVQCLGGNDASVYFPG